MTADAKTAANQLSRLVHLPCASTTSTRAITADAIRAQVIIAWSQGNWRPICDGSNASSVALSTHPCGTLYGPFGGYDGWWFWRRRHHQLGSYLGRIPSELA